MTIKYSKIIPNQIKNACLSRLRFSPNFHTRMDGLKPRQHCFSSRKHRFSDFSHFVLGPTLASKNKQKWLRNHVKSIPKRVLKSIWKHISKNIDFDCLLTHQKSVRSMKKRDFSTHVFWCIMHDRNVKTSIFHWYSTISLRSDFSWFSDFLCFSPYFLWWLFSTFRDRFWLILAAPGPLQIDPWPSKVMLSSR